MALAQCMSYLWKTVRSLRNGCPLLALCLCALLFGPAAAEQEASPSIQSNPEQDRSGETGRALAPNAVNQSEGPTAAAMNETPSKEKQTSDRRGAIIVAPIPISNPSTGTGGVIAVGYIFPFKKADKISPPSIIGAAGLFTNNGTRGFAVLGQFYLKENTYKVTTGFVRGNVNYDLYGSGTNSGLKLPLKQEGQAFVGEFLRRIGWKFFLGPSFVTGRSTLTLRPSSGPMPPVPPDLGLDTTLTAIGIHMTRDTSVNRFYPTSGTFFTFTSDFFSQTLGSKYSFQSYRTAFAKYWAVRQNQVLAYNAYFCGTGGEPPFYGNCIYGTNNQLRGYVAGKYFDRYMVTSQLEYRLVLPKRFGVVAFGGLGGGFPGGDRLLFTSNNFLPSGGGGLRFQLSKQYHVNLRADIAQGKDGHTFSLGIGEAF